MGVAKEGGVVVVVAMAAGSPLAACERWLLADRQLDPGLGLPVSDEGVQTRMG